MLRDEFSDKMTAKTQRDERTVAGRVVEGKESIIQGAGGGQKN